MPALIIGAGHSGLAVSACLRGRDIEHVVLERGQVANSWKHERWDSLCLLTPNWQCRLPGRDYDGDDPDGFMAVPDLIEFIEGYAAAVDAPVHTETTVTRVTPGDDGWLVETDQGHWQADVVMMASGSCNVPAVPALAEELPASIDQVTPHTYRNPEQLADGEVLVVGASATGLQLAEEIHRSGRPVTLSVGEHVRLPRAYRGRDIQFWLHSIGRSNERWDEVDDLSRARNVPSPQLVGTPEHRMLDLNAVSDQGIKLRGRLGGLHEGSLLFSGGLRNQCSLADLKMRRLLGMIDEWIDETDAEAGPGSPDDFAATRLEDDPPLQLDLRRGDIATVLWATGYRADYSWLDLPVLDHKGRVRHDGGVVADAPGLYLMGTQFLRRRKSTFIHGAEDDAVDLADHMAAYLDSLSSTRTPT